MAFKKHPLLLILRLEFTIEAGLSTVGCDWCRADCLYLNSSNSSIIATLTGAVNTFLLSKLLRFYRGYYTIYPTFTVAFLNIFLTFTAILLPAPLLYAALALLIYKNTYSPEAYRL